MSLLRKALWFAPAILCSLTTWGIADELSDSEVPVGSRTHWFSGKKWPLDSRPVGKRQPFWQRVHTSIYWPDPYRWDDRNNVRAALTAQRDNGWMTATTLYDQHFDPLTNEINEAGRIHLRWILLHIPAERRQTWVAAANDAQTSQVRLASVQDEAVQIAGGYTCPVTLRVCLPVSTSAQTGDLVNRAYQTSIPVPRVPYVPLSSQGGGSGSSGSNPQGGSGQ